MSNVQQPTTGQKSQPNAKKPNELGSISVQAHLKIFDPKTQKVHMEGRG
jgi:hypothetical protein